MDELLLAAAELQSAIESHCWRCCFIGGVAVQRWANPRFTQDIDLTLLTGFGEEATFVDGLRLGAQLDVQRDIEGFPMKLLSSVPSSSSDTVVA